MNDDDSYLTAYDFPYSYLSLLVCVGRLSTTLKVLEIQDIILPTSVIFKKNEKWPNLPKSPFFRKKISINKLSITNPILVGKFVGSPPI